MGHPFTNVQPALYWSATTDADHPTDAWVVGFSNGTVTSSTNKAGTGPGAWCVRGGMNEWAY